LSSIISDFSSNLLKEQKVSYDEIVLKVKSEKRPHDREIIKTRIMNSETAKQIVRIDNREKYAEGDLQRYKNKCYYYNFVDFDAIVVSDYNKGIINHEIIERLNKVKCPVFVDTKKKDLSVWKHVEKCFVKINSKEYANSINAHSLKNLIVTEGENGCSYYIEGILNSFSKTREVEKADVVGAGDCFLAGFVTLAMEGHDVEKCLNFANKVASFSVTQIGTSVVNRNDIK